MPISGLVLTLHPDASRRTAALALLNEHSHLELGAGDGLRLPVVVDTREDELHRQIWQWLHELDGVQFVDLVYIHFDGQDGDPDLSRLGPCGGAPAVVTIEGLLAEEASS